MSSPTPSQSEPVVNKSEPIPILKVNNREAGSSESTDSSPATPARSKRAVSLNRMQEKFQDAAAGNLSSSPGSGIQDKLLSLMFQQIVPSAQTQGTPQKPDRRSSKYVARPGFSLPTMSYNFRRFNARIGIVFVFQNRAIRLFSWRTPSQTWSFLAVFTIFCLDPALIPILPLAVCLLFIMVPAFTARHPPPPNSHSTEMYDMDGPASAPPPNIKPAPEASKDFFRNMRDLQNSMEDFSLLHDKVLQWFAPLTNFSDERLSSSVFLGLAITTFALFVVSKLLPWRLVFMIIGWILVGSLHPAMVQIIALIDRRPLIEQLKRLQSRIVRWMNEDIVLDEVPEVREVEIFELQHKHEEDWQPWIYSISPYTPHSPLRVSGDRPRGTRYFEDVQAPKGWEWSNKKWTLDMYSREWVEERMINAVEVETDGERWVYDIGHSEESAEESLRSLGNKGHAPRKDWEESSALRTKGEWRRRRWVRLVKRKVVHAPT